MTRRPRTTAVLGLLLAAGVLVGCTTGSPSDLATTSGAAEPARGGDLQPEESVAGRGDGAPTVQPDGRAVAPVGREPLVLPGDVVRTASLVVEVSQIRTAAEQARRIAEDAGGGLEAEDASGDVDVLRLRVPPDRLAGALEALARLGRETARTVGSEDVTIEVADLDSRLATQRASVARVRELLARAQVLSDVVALEGELAQREAALESLQARAEALRDRADLATVSLTLRAPPPAAAATPTTGFRDGLRAGVDAFVSASRAGAAVLGALLPFLPLLLLAAWGARHLTRRGGGPAATPST